MYNDAVGPMFNQMSGMAQDYMGQPNYGMPDYSGTLTGVSPYNLYGWNVPNAVAPTQDWFNTLSPEVKAGAWAPYKQGADLLTEQLSARGMAGGERSGYSGAMGAAMGDYFSNAAQQYGTNLWNMTQPGLMAQFSGQLGANQAYAGLQNQWSKDMYQNQLQERNTNYQNAMTGWQMPWNWLTSYNALSPSGAYKPEGSGTLGSIMGSAMSLISPFATGYGFSMGSSAGKTTG